MTERIREIVLDTETTGFNWGGGDKILEIGALEVVNRIPTGRFYHQYVNPGEVEISASAIKVHGITNEKVASEPLFHEIVADMLEFFGDAPLVAHNANFDISFLNAELEAAGFASLKNKVVDTLTIARSKYPGQRATLDALCQRFDIDLSEREYHGALLDARLLADVYLELMGGLQGSLLDDGQEEADRNTSSLSKIPVKTTVREPRPFPVDKSELERHFNFVKAIEGNLWGYE